MLLYVVSFFIGAVGLVYVRRRRRRLIRERVAEVARTY